jgi:hypothetical protein
VRGNVKFTYGEREDKLKTYWDSKMFSENRTYACSLSWKKNINILCTKATVNHGRSMGGMT